MFINAIYLIISKQSIQYEAWIKHRATVTYKSKNPSLNTDSPQKGVTVEYI